ncbi:MAG: cell wall metabolism sensor histidine kinase WalK, partial [Chloroflexota bacterium]|nr:cell wall metabolism sensor histidine kinase WalK [Chloroflexota bacterium]
VAAVVVDKRQRTLPGGNDLLLLGMSYVGQIGLVIALLVGIPAIPVGVVIGIRRARGISKPIRELAGCAEAFAEGDLSTRVDVQGEDEIADLGKRFNEMADRLQATIVLEAASRARAEQLLAANRDLVANVSHELRTPVALVRGHLEALDAEPARVEEYTRIALRETDRLERLVADLFHLTRVESQGIALEREPFDAGAAVREAVESLAEPARREAGITMLAEVGAGDLRCVGDRARLVQVLQNLIRNAVRFTPEGGIILASAQDDGDRVTVMVRDTGVGIAPDDLPHVFDRFYRGEQSRNRAAGGAGLGLAIAKQLIEAMSGEISVESELDEGSVFTIRLPRIQVPFTAGTNGAASNGAKAALVAAR